jgi:hypothetical protein
MKIINSFTLVLLFLFSRDLFAQADCRIIFDAGSSGTRLYIYEKGSGENAWIEHEGPKVEAIADPVREIRGKKWSNMQETVDLIPKSLTLIKMPGQWHPFDWEKKCKIISASVLATAGMRIAEQQQPEKSKIIWNNIKTALSKKLGKDVPITARTLTGFEEGLYAWLSVLKIRKGQPDFGIAEMGGASAQVAFSCNNCPGSSKILLGGGKSINIFSHSFLGLGGDVAYDLFGTSPLCAYGAGTTTPNWNETKCAETINIKTAGGIKDPFNFNNGKRDSSVQIPINKAMEWYLTGAFAHMGGGLSSDKCCKSKGNCFEAKTSCFRSVFLQKFLDDLGIKSSSKKVDASWTLGATICQENDCLKHAGPLQCKWFNKGCLN